MLESEEKTKIPKEYLISKENLEELEKLRNYLKEFEKHYIKKFVPFKIPPLVSTYSFSEESAALIDIFGCQVTVPLSSNRENEKRLQETLKEQEKIIFCPGSIISEKEIICHEHMGICKLFCPQMEKFICAECIVQEHKSHTEIKVEEGKLFFLKKLETEINELEVRVKDVRKYNEIFAQMIMEVEQKKRIEEIEKNFAKQWKEQMELMRNQCKEIIKVNDDQFKRMQEHFEQLERKKMEVENFKLQLVQIQIMAKEAPFENELLKELKNIFEENQKMKKKLNLYLKEQLGAFFEQQNKLKQDNSKIQEDFSPKKITAVI